MRGEVLGAHIGLDLDEAAPHATAVDLSDQHLAEQVARDRDGAAVEESGLENLAGGNCVGSTFVIHGPGSRVHPGCDSATLKASVCRMEDLKRNPILKGKVSRHVGAAKLPMQSVSP